MVIISKYRGSAKNKKRNAKSLRSPNTIAIVDVRGPIMYESGPLSLFSSGFVSTGKDIAETLVELAENDRVLGVIVRFNTPGGTVPGSEAIRYGIELCRKAKPVFGFATEVCASGGIYASTAVSRMYALSNSLLGSIGVRGPTLFHFEEPTAINERFGSGVVAGKIHVRPVAIGKGKALGDPYVPLDEEAIRELQATLKETDDHFRALVSASRAMPLGHVQALGAKIMSANEAKRIGLIDELVHSEDAVRKALADELDLKQEDCSFTVVKVGKGPSSPLADMAAHLPWVWGQMHAEVQTHLQSCQMLLM